MIKYEIIFLGSSRKLKTVSFSLSVASCRLSAFATPSGWSNSMRTQFEHTTKMQILPQLYNFAVYVWKALSSQAQITLKFKHPIILENLHKRLWGNVEGEELSFGFNRYIFFWKSLGISPRISPSNFFHFGTFHASQVDDDEALITAIAPPTDGKQSQNQIYYHRAPHHPHPRHWWSLARDNNCQLPPSNWERANERKFQFQTKMLCIKIIFHMRICRCFSIALYAFGFWHEFTEPPSGAFFTGSKNLEFATRSCYVSSHQKFIPSTPQQCLCVYFYQKNSSLL